MLKTWLLGKYGNFVFIDVDSINPRIRTNTLKTKITAPEDVKAKIKAPELKTKINNDLKLRLKSSQIKVQVKCK